MDEGKQIKLKFDAQRMLAEVDLDTFIGAQERQIRAMRNLLAVFVVDETGQYMSEVEGRKVVGKLKLGQLQQLTGQIGEAGERAIVPPKNGAG